MKLMEYPLALGAAAAVAAGLFCIFHLLVIIGVIPGKFVWGGRIENRKELVKRELFSLFIMAIIGIVIFFRGHSLHLGRETPGYRIIMWILAGLFILNTIGNILAKTNFERFVFTPVTIILAFISVCLALAGM